MADINIQRKTSSALLWALAVIAFFLFIWLLFGSDTGSTATKLPASSSPMAALFPGYGTAAGARHNVASVAPMVS